MLWTICVILLVLWLLGLFSGYTLGGVVHILLVIALIVLVAQVIQGRTTIVRIRTYQFSANQQKGVTERLR
jgi:hypothetical protein